MLYSLFKCDWKIFTGYPEPDNGNVAKTFLFIYKSNGL